VKTAEADLAEQGMADMAVPIEAAEPAALTQTAIKSMIQTSMIPTEPEHRVNVRELFVLGVVSRAPIHGHGINRILEISGAERWVDMSAKHVYYVLRKLQGAGLVEAVEERVGGRPPRSVYRITSEGRATLKRWLQSELGVVTAASPFDTVFAMLAYADALDSGETLQVLQRRHAALAAVLEVHVPQAEGDLRAAFGSAAAAMFRKTRDMVEAELAWIDSVLDEVAVHGWEVFRVPDAVTEAVKGDE
jgi:DNA-binding PadR family transcriptional regulator